MAVPGVRVRLQPQGETPAACERRVRKSPCSAQSYCVLSRVSARESVEAVAIAVSRMAEVLNLGQDDRCARSRDHESGWLAGVVPRLPHSVSMAFPVGLSMPMLGGLVLASSVRCWIFSCC